MLGSAYMLYNRVWRQVKLQGKVALQFNFFVEPLFVVIYFRFKPLSLVVRTLTFVNKSKVVEVVGSVSIEMVPVFLQ